MIRDDSIHPPILGTEVHLRTPDGKTWVTVGSRDLSELEHHARRIEANDAVIQAVIPLLRAVRNGLAKRVYMFLNDSMLYNLPADPRAEPDAIRKLVMNALDVDDVELLSMIPTRTDTPAP